MKQETYEQWLADIQKTIDAPSCLWNRIGIWGFPTMVTPMSHDTLIHYCEAYYKSCQNNSQRSWALRHMTPHGLENTHCASCGVVVPDGIKMIALLEKL